MCTTVFADVTSSLDNQSLHASGSWAEIPIVLATPIQSSHGVVLMVYDLVLVGMGGEYVTPRIVVTKTLVSVV